MAKGSYVKLYYSMLDWEWYTDVPTKVVFLHLLLSANYKDKKWKDITIHRGEVVTSYEQLAKESGVTYQQARNAVKKLKSTGEITQYTTHRYSLIHIENFDMYQRIKTELKTDRQQGENEKSNSDLTTPKELKKEDIIKEVEIIKEKNIKKESFSIPPEIAEAFAGFVEMRQKIKRPMTDRAKKMALNKLQELAPNDYLTQTRILDQSTLHCWQGLFPLVENKSAGGDHRGTVKIDTSDTLSAVVY